MFIAEDHALFRGVIRELLAGHPCMQVVGDVGNGALAFDGIKALRPRVAVLDLEMPLWTGLEVAQAVREKGLDTAIILLTMHKEPHLVRSALELGIAGYILKDDLDTDLIPAVEAAAKRERHFSPRLQNIASGLFQAELPLERV